MPENPALNEGTWHQAEEYIRKAFLNLDDASQDLKTKYSQIGFTESSTSVKRRIARVVEIPAGTKLFKLTKWQEKLERNPMSPWWSTHGSFQEDNLGARGIFELCDAQRCLHARIRALCIGRRPRMEQSRLLR